MPLDAGVVGGSRYQGIDTDASGTSVIGSHPGAAIARLLRVRLFGSARISWRWTQLSLRRRRRHRGKFSILVASFDGQAAQSAAASSEKSLLAALEFGVCRQCLWCSHGARARMRTSRRSAMGEFRTGGARIRGKRAFIRGCRSAAGQSGGASCSEGLKPGGAGHTARPSCLWMWWVGLGAYATEEDGEGSGEGADHDG